jgi:hypothetical protein
MKWEIVYHKEVVTDLLIFRNPVNRSVFLMSVQIENQDEDNDYDEENTYNPGLKSESMDTRLNPDMHKLSDLK